MNPVDQSLRMRYFSGELLISESFEKINNFRETQSIIKAQKTDATFGEISKIVASMWDGLAENEKTVSFTRKNIET